MKKIVKTTAKKGIKKAQNGSSLFGPTAAKRAASLRSQKKDENRDYKLLQARRDQSSYVNREAFADSPLTRTKDSWKNDYYGFSNPSKVGSVKKPNVEKVRTAGEKKIMGILEKGKKADGTMKEGAQARIASIRAKERAGIQKLENKAARAENKAGRVEKRAAIGEAKANVKAVKKSFKKGAIAKERVAEKTINPPKRSFYDPYGGSFGFDTKLFADKNGKAVLLGSERAKTRKK